MNVEARVHVAPFVTHALRGIRGTPEPLIMEALPCILSLGIPPTIIALD